MLHGNLYYMVIKYYYKQFFAFKYLHNVDQSLCWILMGRSPLHCLCLIEILIQI